MGTFRIRKLLIFGPVAEWASARKHLDRTYDFPLPEARDSRVKAVSNKFDQLKR
jgi:hypothetical protein